MVDLCFNDSVACVSVDGEISLCWTETGMYDVPMVLQCVLYIEVMKEIYARILERGLELVHAEGRCFICTVQYVDDAVLMADSDSKLGRLLGGFTEVCEQCYLKVM